MDNNPEDFEKNCHQDIIDESKPMIIDDASNNCNDLENITADNLHAESIAFENGKSEVEAESVKNPTEEDYDHTSNKSFTETAAEVFQNSEYENHEQVLVGDLGNINNEINNSDMSENDNAKIYESEQKQILPMEDSEHILTQHQTEVCEDMTSDNVDCNKNINDDLFKSEIEDTPQVNVFENIKENYSDEIQESDVLGKRQAEVEEDHKHVIHEDIDTFKNEIKTLSGNNELVEHTEEHNNLVLSMNPEDVINHDEQVPEIALVEKLTTLDNDQIQDEQCVNEELNNFVPSNISEEVSSHESTNINQDVNIKGDPFECNAGIVEEVSDIKVEISQQDDD